MGNKKLNLFEKFVIAAAVGTVATKATGKILGKFVNFPTSNPGKIWNKGADNNSKK